MCRNIKQLRRAEPPAPEEEITAAALQFVRKVSGYRQPSRLNEASFNKAVAEFTAATQRLMADLVTR